MRFVTSIPTLQTIPPIVDEGGLNNLLSSMGYDPVTDATQRNALIKTLSGIVYRATGQFFSPITFQLIFDGSESTTVYMPYRLVECTEIKVNTVVIPLSEFSIYEDRIIRIPHYFTIGYQNVLITGTFGYPQGTVLPNNVETALKILIEDWLFGDKYTRMQSRASHIQLDKMSITVGKHTASGLTGNTEADMLLRESIWTYRPNPNRHIRYSVL